MARAEQTFRLDNDLQPIHERQQVPTSLADREELPHLTPVVGDSVAYENAAGWPVCRDDALRLMRSGKPVFYTTWVRRT